MIKEKLLDGGETLSPPPALSPLLSKLTAAAASGSPVFFPGFPDVFSRFSSLFSRFSHPRRCVRPDNPASTRDNGCNYLTGAINALEN